MQKNLHKREKVHNFAASNKTQLNETICKYMVVAQLKMITVVRS